MVAANVCPGNGLLKKDGSQPRIRCIDMRTTMETSLARKHRTSPDAYLPAKSESGVTMWGDVVSFIVDTVFLCKERRLRRPKLHNAISLPIYTIKDSRKGLVSVNQSSASSTYYSSIAINYVT